MESESTTTRTWAPPITLGTSSLLTGEIGDGGWRRIRWTFPVQARSGNSWLIYLAVNRTLEVDILRAVNIGPVFLKPRELLPVSETKEDGTMSYHFLVELPMVSEARNVLQVLSNRMLSSLAHYVVKVDPLMDSTGAQIGDFPQVSLPYKKQANDDGKEVFNLWIRDVPQAVYDAYVQDRINALGNSRREDATIGLMLRVAYVSLNFKEGSDGVPKPENMYLAMHWGCSFPYRGPSFSASDSASEGKKQSAALLKVSDLAVDLPKRKRARPQALHLENAGEIGEKEEEKA